jgi:hypothetical protein
MRFITGYDEGRSRSLVDAVDACCSYFNDIVEAESATQGFVELMHDNRSEHGHEINALQRFNIWPEFALAETFRVANALTRGGLASIMDAMTFYVLGVYATFGIGVVALVRLSRRLASDGSSTKAGWIAGTATLLLAACNYHHITRVQLHPPLRENFGVPVSNAFFVDTIVTARA